MRVLLVGELHSTNLGEPLLFECSEYVLHEVGELIQVDKIDFWGRNAKDDKFIGSNRANNPLLFNAFRAIRKIYRRLKKQTPKLDNYIFNLSNESKELHNFYHEKIEKGNYDGIIIMGAGTLKYDVRLNFAPYYYILINVAKEFNVPVYINCVGVESRHNTKDLRCQQFEKALNCDIIKYITTRDDLKELGNYIKNDSIIIDKIADIGTWSAEAYGLSKDNESEIVGLGIITPERFREFGRMDVYKKYIDVWIQLILELNRNGVNWRIFTNGDKEDCVYARKLCEIVNKPIDEYVSIPQNPRELVKIVSGFKGIISSRLHSCIVAYSLNVPFVAISWNNKLKYFGAEIQVSERIIGEDKFSVDYILRQFEKALEEGYDLEYKKKYRESSKIYMYKYLQSMRGEE